MRSGSTALIENFSVLSFKLGGANRDVRGRPVRTLRAGAMNTTSALHESGHYFTSPNE